MGAEQSLQTKKSVDKKDKKPVDKKIVKKPVDKKVVKNPVDKKVVKKPVDKKVVKKLIKGGRNRNVKPYHPSTTTELSRSMYIKASELNKNHINMILRCQKIDNPEAGIIESIDFYEKGDNSGDIPIQNFKEGNKNKLFKITVTFISNSEYNKSYLDLKPDDICYLVHPKKDDLDYFKKMSN